MGDSKKKQELEKEKGNGTNIENKESQNVGLKRKTEENATKVAKDKKQKTEDQKTK